MNYGKWLCGYLWLKPQTAILSSIFLRYTPKWPLRNFFCTLTLLWEIKIPSHWIFFLSVAFVAVLLSAHLAVRAPALSACFPLLFCWYSGELKWQHLHAACDLVCSHRCESYKCLSAPETWLLSAVCFGFHVSIFTKYFFGKKPVKIRRHFKLALCSGSCLFRFFISARFCICMGKDLKVGRGYGPSQGEGNSSWDELPALHRYI